MDSHHQPNNDQEMPAKDGGSVLCRQSSTRWTPTSEQIRILKDLYYNNGVRSPTADQIQRISAKLRQYGKIEGKNVFYWFQNHKARERQKKRFTADHPIPPIHRPSPSPAHHHLHHHHLYNKFSNINSGFPSGSSSSPGVISHVGNYGYGSSLAMEKSFRECSISASGNGGGGSMGQNYAWIDPYASSPYPFLEKTSYAIGGQTLEVEPTDQYDEEEAAIETLPLFPVHGDTIKHENDYFTGWNRHGGDDGGAMASRASLELTLNSYAARFPTSP